MQTLKLSRPQRLLGLALILATACACAAEPLTMDAAYLRYAKERIAAKDPAYAAPMDKLLHDADALLARPSDSVVNKTMLPPSGDKHDYMSLAPYFWPDPGKPGGLPYLRRDGQFNPAAKNGDTDSVRMHALCTGVEKLALAYYFSGEAKYADKAAEAIRSWFLAPATRMNPNLNYGQAVMGRNTGRGIGLIDTRDFWMVIDALPLIAPSGALSADETAGLRQWFRDFMAWMRDTDIGKSEAAAANNHGMYYDMQVAVYALFVGDAALARATVRHALDQRIAVQVDKDGKQPRELERTTPFHYSVFNLEAMEQLARYGEQVGVDVWHAHEQDTGLRKALDYLLPYALHPASWPYHELRKLEPELMLPLLLRADRAYGPGSYAPAVAALPNSRAKPAEAASAPLAAGGDELDLLIWPLKPPGRSQAPPK